MNSRQFTHVGSCLMPGSSQYRVTSEPQTTDCVTLSTNLTRVPAKVGFPGNEQVIDPALRACVRVEREAWKNFGAKGHA